MNFIVEQSNRVKWSIKMVQTHKVSDGVGVRELEWSNRDCNRSFFFFFFWIKVFKLFSKETFIKASSSNKINYYINTFFVSLYHGRIFDGKKRCRNAVSSFFLWSTWSRVFVWWRELFWTIAETNLPNVCKIHENGWKYPECI